MNKFEEINLLPEISNNCDTNREFSNESLNRFDELLEGKKKESTTITPSVFEKVIDDLKRKNDGDKYGEMGATCISIIDDMEDVFEDDSWAEMIPEERGKIFDELAQRIGRECGIKIMGVKFFGFPPYVNGYENGDGYLHLHDKYLTEPKLKEDALHTFFHEARHTFQKAAVDNPKLYGVDEKKAEQWEKNLENYLTPEKFGYLRYYMQPVEADANEFADYVLKNKR